MTVERIPYRFLCRGGTAAALTALNEVPLERELVFETDTHRSKLGDGVTAYNALPYVSGGTGGGATDVDRYATSVVSLLRMQTGTVVDDCGKAWTLSGDAHVVSTAPFGGSSVLLDGVGDYFSTPASADFNFGSGEWSVEAIVRFNTPTGSAGILGQWDSSTAQQAWALYMSGGALTMRFRDTSGSYRDTSITFTPISGAWYWLAAGRDALGTVRLLVNGAVAASNTFPQTILTSTKPVVCGIVQGFEGLFDMPANVAGIRVCKGLSRFTTGYPPLWRQFEPLS